ncbi:MAG: hypothetical protein JW864_06350 [Spirochaetes bacterium]|nr:hypothetical protein [Spirochaetota bacterium]
MQKKIILVLIIIFSLSITVNARLMDSEKVIDKEQLEILPSGRCTGSIIENWLTDAVFLQVESGGLSRVDPIRFSPRGISWIEQNFRLNGIDITDPYKSGYPLFEPSWESIKSISLQSAGENGPFTGGINWNTGWNAEKNHYSISYNNIFPAGNTDFIPDDTFDREPSFEYGSPEDRRRYRTSNEVNASYYIDDRFYIGNELLLTQREFPTLVDEYGNKVYEKAEKYTLTSAYNSDNLRLPYSVLLVGQYNHNDNYGANLRLDDRDTLTQQAFVNHLQINARKRVYKGDMNILSGITLKTENLDSHLDKPLVTEFDTESGPVPDAGDITRFNFDNALAYKYDFLNLEAGLKLNGLYYKPDKAHSQTMQSLDGNVFSVTLWDDPNTCREYVLNTRFKAEAEKQWGFFSLSGNIYFDNSRAAANGEEVLNWFGIGGRLRSGFELKKTGTDFFICALHQPSKLNSNIVAFLNNKRPSGTVYGDWTDSNNNGIAEESEIAGATVVSSTGGKYHYKDSNLKRPSHDEISAGIGQEFGKFVTVTVQGYHRIFSDYLIVNYETYDGAYSTAADGYEIYNKQAGIDKYCLTNYSGETAHSSGAEMQFVLEWKRIYFNLMFAAFLVKGYAPIGNGADYNDYAVITEDTASPNSRTNSTDGRLCSDRAYMGNILLAYKIRKDLSLGLTIKYRDGEPFTQFRIYTDSNGMPVKVMDQTRGNWFNQGTGRYTFAWNIDLKLRYNPFFRDKGIEFTLDIYNILGSSTEIIESNDPDDERLALEAVPQRMINCGLQVSF